MDSALGVRIGALKVHLRLSLVYSIQLVFQIIVRDGWQMWTLFGEEKKDFGLGMRWLEGME